MMSADLIETALAPKRDIRANFDSYVGHTAYEESARRKIARLGDEENLPFAPDRDRYVAGEY